MNKTRILFFFTIILLLVFSSEAILTYAVDEYDIQEVLDVPEVMQMIEAAMESERAPGVSIVVADESRTVYYNSGYAHIKDKKKTTESTLYELGSTTKAFTALAILILEDERFISIDDNVSEYIPWFNVKYNNESMDITIKQLLMHTSGLPNSTMSHFPEGNSDDLLEKTVRLTEGIKLNYMPGTQYEYANIGYDLLAYIIQMVTGEKYEEFVTERILYPLGMKNSGFNYEEVLKTGRMAQGYSQFFMRTIEYDAPRYQGCLGDGYLITCASDMGLWLKAQMGGEDVPEQLARVIQKSHEINEDNTIVVSTFRGQSVYYTYGWEVSADGKMITHSGSNPNFSSNIINMPDLGVSVCIMSNIQGNHTVDISQNIIKALLGENLKALTPMNGPLDSFLSLCIAFTEMLNLVTVIRLFSIRKRIRKKKKTKTKTKMIIMIAKTIIYAVLTVLLGLWPYLVGYNYNMVQVWMPKTLTICGFSLFALAILLLISSIMELTGVYIARPINYRVD